MSKYEAETIKITEEVYCTACKICGRRFKSLYPRQLENLIDNHMKTHEK